MNVLRTLRFLESCFLPLRKMSQKKVDFEWDNANISNLFIKKNGSLTFSELMFAKHSRFPFSLAFFFTLLMAVVQVAKLFVGSTALQ